MPGVLTGGINAELFFIQPLFDFYYYTVFHNSFTTKIRFSQAEIFKL